jgi:hypothetical protein
MRSDIAPGAIFPDYELSDHTARGGSSPSCKDSIRWSSSSAAVAIVPRIAPRCARSSTSSRRLSACSRASSHVISMGCSPPY